MAGFFKRMFGGGDEKKKARRLSHPRDLRVGDIVKFRYVDQSDVSGKEFEVSLINTYMYGNLCYPELILKDRSSNIIYMMVEEEDGEEYLALSKKVGKTQLDEIIGQSQLDAVLQRGTGTRVTIKVKPVGLEEWLTEKYTESDDNIKGSFVKGDARYLSNEDVNRRENFSSYTLVDKSDKYALEIEVYEAGQIELSATVYHEIEEIEEMWPGKASDLNG
jgi:hypothetical protein